MTKLPLNIAKRYIFPRGNINFISIITLISIIGISVGVASLIIVLSIFNGFREISVDTILSMDPAVRIEPRNEPYIIDYDILFNEINLLKLENDNAFYMNAYLRTKSVLMYKTSIEVVELIAPVNNQLLLDSAMFIGRKELKDNSILIGIALADKLGINLYDSVDVLSLNDLEYSIQTLSQPLSKKAEILGVFQCDVKDYDLTTAFTDYSLVKQLLAVNEKNASYIDIKLGNNWEKADEIAKKIKQRLDVKFSGKYEVLTWKDLNRDLYSIMQMERVAVFATLSLILFIAIFNVFASLAMSVTEKSSSISILKSFGADKKFISKIYRYEGIMVGGIGTIIGLIIGVGLTLGQVYFGWIQLDGNLYLSTALPVVLEIWDVVIVCIFSIFLAFIATIYPAKKAAEMKLTFSDE